MLAASGLPAVAALGIGVDAIASTLPALAMVLSAAAICSVDCCVVPLGAVVLEMA
jgi:hypothetical protein